MLKPNQTNKNIKRYVVFLRDFHTTLGSPKTCTIYNHVKTYVLWRRFFSETCEFVRMMDGHRNGKVSTEMKNLARTTTQMNYDMASAGPRGFRGLGGQLYTSNRWMDSLGRGLGREALCRVFGPKNRGHKEVPGSQKTDL